MTHFLTLPPLESLKVHENTKILAFAGKSGVGKDTAAWFLVKMFEGKKVGPMLSFAQPLKMACSYMLGYPTSLPFSSQAMKNVPGFGGRTPKEVAQFMGTEVARNMLHPDIWVHLMHQEISYLHRTVIITDLRFQNEYEYIMQNGGHVIHIHRDVESRGIPGHASDQIKFNVKEGDSYHALTNNGALEEFEQAVLDKFNQLFPTL